MRKDFLNHLMNWLIFLISVFFKLKSKNFNRNLKFTRIMLVFCSLLMILDMSKTTHLKIKCFNFHFKTLIEIATLQCQVDKVQRKRWPFDFLSLETLMMMDTKVLGKHLNKTLSIKSFLRLVGLVEQNTTWKRNHCFEVLLKQISQVIQKTENQEDSFNKKKKLKYLQTQNLNDHFNKKSIGF